MRWQGAPASHEYVRRFCYFLKPAEGVALLLGSEVPTLFVSISHAGCFRCPRRNLPRAPPSHRPSLFARRLSFELHPGAPLPSLSAGLRITLRSRGAPTARHQALATGTVYIVCAQGLASRRRRPLTSNVRPRNPHAHALPRPCSLAVARQQSTPRSSDTTDPARAD